jgi:hypothetical protein
MIVGFLYGTATGIWVAVATSVITVLFWYALPFASAGPPAARGPGRD